MGKIEHIQLKQNIFWNNSMCKTSQTLFLSVVNSLCDYLPVKSNTKLALGKLLTVQITFLQ